MNIVYRAMSSPLMVAIKEVNADTIKGIQTNEGVVQSIIIGKADVN
jgi:hypothetical protein